MDALNITLSTPKVTEYRLRYFFDGRRNDIKIFAESDAEAIHDADILFARLNYRPHWNHYNFPVILWDITWGRRVKQYR